MSQNSKLAAAALAGLFAAGIIAAQPALADDKDPNSCKSTTDHDKKDAKSNDHKKIKEAHACKGLNSCAGQGADGLNSCKGQGSCATDGGVHTK